MSFRTISVRLTGNASSLNSALYQASRTIGDFGRGIERGAAGSLLKFGATATLAGTAVYALERAFTASVRQAVAFDAAMRNVNSISGLSERQLHGLGQSVLDLSKNVPQSATNLANGLYQIASSGFQGAQGLTILKASAVAATAGLTDTATSAQVIVGALNAYGLGADQATKVSDELFQTVNVGVLTFNDLAQGMGDVVGTAAAAKVSLGDVGAAIATMTRAGVVPAEAFTSLNRVIISILQPSTAMAQVFKQLGYQSGAAALQTKGLQGVMNDLRRVTGGSAQTMFQLFTDIRGARGALALMTNQGKLYNDVSKQFSDSNEINGRTLRTFNEQMKSVSAQWTLFKNRVSAVSIEAATHLLPAILSLIKSMTELGHAAGHVFSDLAPFFTALRNVGADLFSVFKAILDVATPLGKAIAGLVGGAVIATLNELGQAVAAVTGYLRDHKTIIELVAAVYIARLLPALQVAAWKALSTVIVALDSAVFGLAGSLTNGAAGLKSFITGLDAAKVGSAAASIELVGIGAELLVFSQASQRASQHARELASGVDLLNITSGKSKAALQTMNEDLAAADKTLRSYGSGWKQFGLGLVQVLTPFTSNTVLNAADTRNKTKAQLSQMVADYNTTLAELTSVGLKSGAIQADQLNQLNPLYARTADDLNNLQTPVGEAQTKLAALAALADQLQLGPALAAGGAEGAAAAKQLGDAWTAIGANVGTTTDAVVNLVGEDINAMEDFAKAVKAAEDATRSAFTGATDVISQFDPAGAADSVKSAQDKLTQAQKSLKDETAQYNAEKKHSVSSDQQLAKSRQNVADATKGLADANKQAKNTGDLATIYRNDIAAGQKFVSEIQTAIKRGLDPRLVTRLLQAGPEQAGPILDQLVSDHSGRLIKLANTSEATLSRISEQAVRVAQFTATAVNAPLDKQARLAADLPKAIALQQQLFATGGKQDAAALARALRLSEPEAERIAAEYGIVLPTKIQAYLNANPVAIRVTMPTVHNTKTGVTVSTTRERIMAAGGYVTGPGGPTSDSIPAWLSNQEFVQPAKAVAYYGVPFMEAIRRLQLPRFAGGGQVSPLRRFADGGQARTGSSAPTVVRVVEQPATYITRHETNVGEVRPYDSREFLTWMEQQKRRKAYAP